MYVLPRASEAIIPIEKLTKYALNPNGDTDKAKPKGNHGFGETYEVVMDVIGENQKTAKVLTAWLDDVETGEMRLITLYVDRKEGKHEYKRGTKNQIANE